MKLQSVITTNQTTQCYTTYDITQCHNPEDLNLKYLQKHQ